MTACDHQPQESWKLQLNRHREEVMHCHKCGKYKAHYKAVEKKQPRQIIETKTNVKDAEPGWFGNGD